MENKANLDKLLEESIRLELLVSDLYLYYHVIFEDHKDFWWAMTHEEKNHASILKSCRLFLDLNKLPERAVYENIEAIRNMRASVGDFLKKCRTNEVSMKDAYAFALALEQEASEFHFQEMLTSLSTDKIINIFQRLGKDDVDHAGRIERLMVESGFPTSSSMQESRYA